jgi:alpha-1,3-mannosyltransferase
MALSIKMSILLYLPGLLAILFRRGGLVSTLRHSITIALAQILLALPFLRENASSYLQRSFDFGRIFLYKWTVNWRFVEEETFLSPLWATGLLIGQAAALIAFGLWRWFSKDGGVWAVVRRGLQRPTAPAGFVPVTANGEPLCMLWLERL